MKKLFLIMLSLTIVGVTIVWGLNLIEKKCNDLHLIKSHDCATHLANAKANWERCPTCFSYYDEYNYCPTCDYEQCPGCGEWSLLKGIELCRQCGYSPERVCKNCGEVSYKCDCEVPKF